MGDSIRVGYDLQLNNQRLAADLLSAFKDLESAGASDHMIFDLIERARTYASVVDLKHGGARNPIVRLAHAAVRVVESEEAEQGPDDGADDSPVPADFDAFLTDDQVKEAIGLAASYGVNQRLMLHALTRGGEQLVEGFRQGFAENDGKELFGLLDAIQDYTGHLKNLLNLCKTMQARLVIVGQALAAEAASEPEMYPA